MSDVEDGLSEAEWEAAVLAQTLGLFTNPDGSIDFDRLRAIGIIIDLEDLFNDDDEDLDVES